MASRRRAPSDIVGGITKRAQPRLLAWVVAQGATVILFLISHFEIAPCALCRTQQFLMLILVAVLTLNLTDKRPRRFLRQAIWLTLAGLLVAVAHLALSVGSVADPCAGLTVCGHTDTPAIANRAAPALAALLLFGAILLLTRRADTPVRPQG